MSILIIILNLLNHDQQQEVINLSISNKKKIEKKKCFTLFIIL